MVSIQASTTFTSSSSSKIYLPSPNKFTITNAISAPKYLKNPKITIQRLPKYTGEGRHTLTEDLNKLTDIPSREERSTFEDQTQRNLPTIKLYTILEAINDRIEMHHNIGQQREDWNSLLLNSINMITLTAATMSGVAAASGSQGVGLKVSSTLLFLAGTGILLIMNKIQPSQLVEEQRNAVRLLKRVRTEIETRLTLGTINSNDVDDATEKVLALDRAYPLPLLGAMIEKFPKSLEPAKWWPTSKKDTANCMCSSLYPSDRQNNGWTKELEDDIREIVGVTKSKDIEDYIRLGNKALKLNKMLAISGPLLTGMAALGAALGGHHGGAVAAVAGSMAAAVNTIEHGGQVGMVFEMYRNCAGFFKLLEETIEITLEEKDLEKRENGEVFGLKMGLHLGRSLSELREFAEKSRTNGGFVDEFASKLF